MKLTVIQLLFEALPRGYKKLFIIRLSGCSLKDDSVQAIASIPGLGIVSLDGTSLSKEAVAELQKARPALRITPPDAQ